MTRWLLTSTSRSFADFATTIDAPFIPLPVPAAAMQQRGLFPNSNPYQIIMFDLHKETVDVLKHFFEWYHISYSDDYTRWGMETTGYDPDNIFPGKSQYHTIYYFPEIHMEV